MTPRWLVISITSTVAGIIILSVGWWATCSFYIGPKLFEAYVASDGKLPAEEPSACKDVDNRAVQTMLGLFAALTALAANPPDSKP